MISWENLDTLSSYKKLQSLKNAVSLKDVLSGDAGASRVKEYSAPMAAGLSFNYASRQVNDQVLQVLSELASEAQLTQKFEALYNGEVINTGENRMVLHHLLRGQLGGKVEAEGSDKREFYLNEQKRIADFAEQIHSGKITNEKGEKFTTVCQIGIGGSDLGPRAMYLALENWAKTKGKFFMDAHFISNVDPDDATAVLKSIDISKTIFILVSKSGTTLETLTNEAFVKDAIKKANLDVSKHMIAVTSETSPLAHNSDYMQAFYMDDFIGGRYSSTSGVGGAVLSLAFGADVFAQFLEGAAEADKSATQGDIRKNAAMLDALIGLYERNVQGYPSTAILPYSQALSRFPAHLQQLDMESNGKSEPFRKENRLRYRPRDFRRARHERPAFVLSASASGNGRDSAPIHRVQGKPDRKRRGDSGFHEPAKTLRERRGANHRIRARKGRFQPEQIFRGRTSVKFDLGRAT